MKRYLLALVVAVASLSTTAAQPPVIPAPAPTHEVRPPFPQARWMFSPTPGVFYWDSGEYLLGGMQGLSRSTGMWTMQQPATATGSSGTGFDSAATSGSCATCGSRGRVLRR